MERYSRVCSSPCRMVPTSFLSLGPILTPASAAQSSISRRASSTPVFVETALRSTSTVSPGFSANRFGSFKASCSASRGALCGSSPATTSDAPVCPGKRS